MCDVWKLMICRYEPVLLVVTQVAHTICATIQCQTFCKPAQITSSSLLRLIRHVDGVQDYIIKMNKGSLKHGAMLENTTAEHKTVIGPQGSV